MSLAERLRSHDFLMINQALRELPSIPLDEAVGILEELALESNDSSRGYALQGMAKISPDRAKTLAMRFLDDPGWSVRAGAIYRLWQMGNGDATPQVSRILATDPHEIVRSWAAFYLGVFGDESVLSVLRTAAEEDTGADHEGVPIRLIALNSIQRIESRTSATES